ncbi:MAG: hypothetical protein EAZ64_05505 [Sphingobacteriales bacterium]|nr:MAG: hypothetical protein EAZ64_05505 [Sphingobacteriales bacterium]
MVTKLTLIVEKSIIERTKFYAKSNSKSLSKIIQNCLDTITKERSNQKLTFKLNKMVGAVKNSKNFNEDAELQSYYKNKHL